MAGAELALNWAEPGVAEWTAMGCTQGCGLYWVRRHLGTDWTSLVVGIVIVLLKP